jgi:hypothetical protein
MYFVSGCLNVSENGWMTSQWDDIYQFKTTALTKTKYDGDVSVSADYTFLPMSHLENQYLSIFFGMENGMAVCLQYNDKKTCDIYLAKKVNEIWEMSELLIPDIASNGRVEVKRQGNKLKINCNRLSQFEIALNQSNISGEIGLHCQGSYFRNFSIMEV